MALWADFHPRVMPYVMGCPFPTVDQALIDSARDFCAKTHCWVFTSTSNVYPFDSRAEFDIDTETEVVKVMSLAVNGQVYDIKATTALRDDWRTNPPDDCTLYHDNRSEFLIFPVPASTDAVDMKMSLKPTYAATGVDDEVFSLYAEGIAAGARARLQRMPRQPWTDLSQAQIDGLAHMAAIQRAANVDFARTMNHRVQKAAL